MRFPSFLMLAGLVLCGSGLVDAKAETYGFGSIFRRSGVVLERRLAPEVQLSNVSLDVVFPRGTNGLDGQRFTSQFETYLVQGGQNLSLQNHDPQYEIRLAVVSFDRPRVERKTQNGTTTATAVGSATMTYQLIHRVDGQAVIAGTESYNVQGVPINGSGGTKPLFGLPIKVNSSVNANVTDDSVDLQLIRGLAGLIASHLVLMDEPVDVPLAHGPGLDGADKLAEAKRWNEYLEALSTMPPAPTPEDDAYRVYDIGVANEALGYASENPKVTLKYLREASVQYSKAMEARGSEKNFTTCQERIEKALTRYTTLEQRSQQNAQLQAADVKREQDNVAARRAGAIDNSDIIKLVRARVDPSIILLKIRTAPIANFDLSTDGLVQLSQSGVTPNVIEEMTRRMETPMAPARTPAAAPVRR